MRNNFKSYCDKATDEGETIVVTRKQDKNVVILSLDRYNEMEKEIENAKYLERLDKSFEQLQAGKGKRHRTQWQQ
ncbi:MAG: type II toxin-antitoxin system Phd/YefM family antitoxin [Lachnospiraceae bacterium]|uniref:Antitoxin n=1 Tax=Candidatus Weimeria bifida TaxID=2599074 RepID=A0A6N7IX95_9FIRM|nr:type II toxin-antitoxin system Phd/YefM family antitoxin [Candidatus Weimeria bifida]RRF97206.1 MAG: type II toxin-antitoxin system Phd/YefM family antitoxin [Lachnospiraceae bacterium]